MEFASIELASIEFANVSWLRLLIVLCLALPADAGVRLLLATLHRRLARQIDNIGGCRLQR